MDILMTLEGYFRQSIIGGKIDFRLRICSSAQGISFYIHPLGADGETLDFYVRGDTVELIPKFSTVIECDLPEWQCHKVVRADRITHVSVLSSFDDPVPPTSYDVILRLACGKTVSLPKTFIARAVPNVDDYYVLYEDGYQSWSPKSAFESGYALSTKSENP
jgi:hypothetical protein